MSFFFNDANGNQQGPFNVQQLRVLAGRRAINPATSVVTDAGHRGLAWQIPGLFNFTFTDAFGTERTVNSQELRTLAVEGIVTPTTLLETNDGLRGYASQFPGLKFAQETKPQPPQFDEEQDKELLKSGKSLIHLKILKVIAKVGNQCTKLALIIVGFILKVSPSSTVSSCKQEFL